MTFGDPNEDEPLPGVLESRGKTSCAADDLICEGKAIVLPAHLSYGSVSELLYHAAENESLIACFRQDTSEAAAFVVSRV